MTPVELVNLALVKIGHSDTLTALSDESRAAYTGNLVHDHMLRAILRSFPWPFATKYLDLTLVQGPFNDGQLVQAWSATPTYAIGDIVEDLGVQYWALASTTNDQPPSANWTTEPTLQANGDWLYAYRWPSDCLFARRIVKEGGDARAFDRAPMEFRVGRDVNGLLIYSNQALANLEYTMIDCTNLWADDIWIDAFTWRLAAMLAPSLSRDEAMPQKCFQMYLLTREEAASVASAEGQQHPPGEAEWIDAR